MKNVTRCKITLSNGQRYTLRDPEDIGGIDSTARHYSSSITGKFTEDARTERLTMTGISVFQKKTHIIA